MAMPMGAESPCLTWAFEAALGGVYVHDRYAWEAGVTALLCQAVATIDIDRLLTG